MQPCNYQGGAIEHECMLKRAEYPRGGWPSRDGEGRGRRPLTLLSRRERPRSESYHLTGIGNPRTARLAGRYRR